MPSIVHVAVAIGVAIVSVILFSVAPAAADARTPMRTLDTAAASSVVTDGSRTAVWTNRDGQTTVWDTRRDVRHKLATPRGFRAVGLGGGFVLLTAYPGTGRVVLVELRTGRQFTPANSPQLPAETTPCVDGVDSIVFERVGAEGLGGYCPTGRGAATVLYNWRTGATFLPDSTSMRRSDLVESLSTPSLLRRLCAPLRRVESEAPGGYPAGAFLPYTVAGRHGLTYDRLLVGLPLWQGVRLDRCGRTRAAVLSRQPAASAQLGNQEASWLSAKVSNDTVASARAVLYSLTAQTRVSWPVKTKKAKPSSVPPSVAHTNRRIFVSVALTTPGAFDIRTAVAPAGRKQAQRSLVVKAH